jgi:hypothetical protein
MVDFDAVIFNRDNKPYKTRTGDGDAATTVNVTLGSLAYESLMAATQKDQNLSGAEKYRRYKLANKCFSGQVELDVEDIAYIKTRIGEVCLVNFVGPAWDLLDPEGEAKPVKKERQRPPAPLRAN